MIDAQLAYRKTLNIMDGNIWELVEEHIMTAISEERFSCDIPIKLNKLHITRLKYLWYKVELFDDHTSISWK